MRLRLRNTESFPVFFQVLMAVLSVFFYLLSSHQDKLVQVLMKQHAELPLVLHASSSRQAGAGWKTEIIHVLRQAGAGWRTEIIHVLRQAGAGWIIELFLFVLTQAGAGWITEMIHVLRQAGAGWITEMIHVLRHAGAGWIIEIIHVLFLRQAGAD